MKGKYFKVSICIIIVLSIVLSSITLTAQAQLSNVDGSNIQRKGAWVDSLVFSVVPQNDVAVSQLQANQLDLYAYGLTDTALYQTVKNDPALTYSTGFGLYTDITYNPATFNNGKFNPFINPKIREATNWLLDRNKIVQDIFGGLAQSRLLPFVAGFPEYERYLDAVLAAESKYSYDWNKANSTISAEMQNMGAVLTNGKWNYNGQPVVVIFIIRTEDQRRQIGDYFSNQLESVGFTVDRQYKTRSEASPIWNQSNPANGLWHLYTGGWITTAVTRDDATNFAYFYTNSGSASPLWQAYTNDPAYHNDSNTGVADKLWNGNFATWQERDTLFRQAIPLALESSNRVWIEDAYSFFPRRASLDVSSDLAGGVTGSSIYPFTLKWQGQEGGGVRIAQPFILVDPWNPVAGSNWIYDAMPIRATSDYGTLVDPNTGLSWPQRIESAHVVARTGLPITHTLGWLDLSFAPSITVPADTWVDWDAASQRFITAGEKYPATLPTALTKTTIVYPVDLFTSITWHDGSPLSMADFIMKMILTFDRTKPGSAIYDSSYVPEFDSLMSWFKGVRIVSTNPLTIETYGDLYYRDAEDIASQFTWWPQYGTGPGAWHTVGLGVRAEAAKKLAFSAAKANELQTQSPYVQWASYIAGPSLDILHTFLVSSSMDSYVPYAPTLNNYLASGEASARWNNLGAWYGTKNNFWVGTGPFYLSSVDLVNFNKVTLSRNPNYVDPAGKWDWTVTAATHAPSLTANYLNGAPGSAFNLTGRHFPINSTATIRVNNMVVGTINTGPMGDFIFTLSTDAGTDIGFYSVTATVNPSASLLLKIDSNFAVRAQSGTWTTSVVPDGLAFTHILNIPLIRR